MVTRRKPRRRRIANPTRYARETGTRLPRWRDKLAAYEKEGGYFVHFSNFPKFGINPVNKYGTPTGFYAYPLKFGSIANFANERPYAIVFRPAGARLWRMGDYRAADYRGDIAMLADANPYMGDHRIWAADARDQTLSGQMWNVTRMLSGRNVARWTRILYSVLGYDGVIDECGGIIHPDEPCQAVFFNLRRMQLVDIIDKGTSEDIKPRPERFDISREDWSNRDLQGRSFKEFIAVRTNFRGSNMRDAFMGGAVLNGANLSGVDMSKWRANNVSLVGADMSGADIRDAWVRQSDFRRSDLRDANMREAILIGSDFRSAILDGADMRDADMRHTNLRGVDLRKARVGRVDFTNALRSPSDHPIKGWVLVGDRLDRPE